MDFVSQYATGILNLDCSDELDHIPKTLEFSLSDRYNIDLNNKNVKSKDLCGQCPMHI
jgi:hypothetical protein